MTSQSKLELLREHEAAPGKTYENRLIIGGGDGGILNEMELHETTDDTGNKLYKFRGKLQEADAINKNNRKYTKAILEQNVESLKDILCNGGLVGELDHPSDSIVHFANSSHKFTKLWWEGNILMGEGVFLSTPSGKVLRALINDGVRIGMSSRGVGNGKVDSNGVLVIGESYKLITFDAVADPSTYAAFQERVAGSTKESVLPINTSTFTQQHSTNGIKNESSGIYKVTDSKILEAYLRGMFQSQTNKIKARLN